VFLINRYKFTLENVTFVEFYLQDKIVEYFCVYDQSAFIINMNEHKFTRDILFLFSIKSIHHYPENKYACQTNLWAWECSFHDFEF